jgi:hypothetical protein
MSPYRRLDAGVATEGTAERTAGGSSAVDVVWRAMVVARRGR